jgi:hypothetical protein
MDQFELLGALALKLHNEFKNLYFLMLPIFFGLSIALAWFRNPQGSPEFIESLKRIFIGTLLLIGFPEITDTILMVANGIAAKIDNMSGLETMMQMASDKAKGYTLSPTSVLLAFNDLIVAVVSFLSYIVLYVARYIMVALYHFSWIFLSLISPLLLLFHVFSPKMTANLFRTMFEVASWKIVWAVLSAMLTALPFGKAYLADGSYLTVIVINFVIALAMLGTPLIVKSLIGNGLSAVTSAMGPAVATTMIAIPAKAASMTQVGRKALTDTAAYTQQSAARIASRMGFNPAGASRQNQSVNINSAPKQNNPPPSSQPNKSKNSGGKK